MKRGKGPLSPEAAAEKLIGLLGLAHRSGKLALGASAVQKAVARGRRPLVIIAAGAGESQKQRFLKLSPVRGFLVDVLDREQLASRLGRRELAVVALDDPDFRSGIERLGLDIVTPVDRPHEDGQNRR